MPTSISQQALSHPRQDPKGLKYQAIAHEVRQRVAEHGDDFGTPLQITLPRIGCDASYAVHAAHTALADLQRERGFSVSIAWNQNDVHVTVQAKKPRFVSSHSDGDFTAKDIAVAARLGVPKESRGSDLWKAGLVRRAKDASDMAKAMLDAVVDYRRGPELVLETDGSQVARAATLLLRRELGDHGKAPRHLLNTDGNLLTIRPF